MIKPCVGEGAISYLVRTTQNEPTFKGKIVIPSVRGNEIIYYVNTMDLLKPKGSPYKLTLLKALLTS